MAVDPLDQALGLRIGRPADIDPGGQGAAEGLAVGRQLRLAAAMPTDRDLDVLDQQPRHPVELGKGGPPAGEQVFRGA